MSHRPPSAPDIQTLRHRINLLQLELAQQKLKAKRMAIHATYLEVLLKRTREGV